MEVWVGAGRCFWEVINLRVCESEPLRCTSMVVCCRLCTAELSRARMVVTGIFPRRRERR